MKKKKKSLTGITVAALMTLQSTGLPSAWASSHREALAILNDPCVDNTDVYAWVTPGTHDKLYLIASINGLHEPGQGNQQTRLCDDVLYEFHITRGNGDLEDAFTYQIEFDSTPPTRVDPANLNLPPGGGKELLIQISGGQQTYTVTKVEHRPGKQSLRSVIGSDIPVAPPNVGPQTDRIAYGLGSFVPYDQRAMSGDTSSAEDGLYDDAFAASFIRPLGVGGSEGRAWAGTRDDAFYLDEKGIFDIINFGGNTGIPGARSTPGEDIFAGFNVNTIALEIPTANLFGGMIPHNGTCGDDTLLGVWVSESRRRTRVLNANGFNDANRGEWVQVGREAIPLVNAGLIGTQDQGKYLRTTPLSDVENFAPYFLNPILVRDAEFLGIYRALGVPQATVESLKTGRVDILQAINLDNIPAPGCHHVPIARRKTGDVLRVDVAVDSQFPNGRMIPGGAAPNMEQVDVSDVLLSVIVAGGALPVSDGVDYNDKDYLTEFPWLALPHQGLNEGHGAPTPPIP